MRICAVTKFPPIQGGVSARCYWLSRALAERGHHVTVVTNANEVEDDYRIWLPPEDLDRLEASFPGGGSVAVVSSGRFERGPSHVPYANPYVTKLAALATDEIRRHELDLVFSCYFEPYGLSGHLAASWTGRPHVAQHAGSDRTRLMDHPELSTAYKELVRSATAVVTGDLDLQGLGIPPARLVRLKHGFLPPEFRPEGRACDLDALIARLAELGSPGVSNRSQLDPEAATLGLYGKVGEAKGSYDLVAALSRLRDRGVRFNLVAMVGGRERGQFLAVIQQAGLADRVWTLPFLAHWRVPEIIRACTAVCFLERQFPVEIHAPGIPREIMACGTCAVLSEEVARKQPFWPQLRHGENALLVPDPTDVAALARALGQAVADPTATRSIGRAGAALVETGSLQALGETYEAVFQQSLAARAGSAPVRTATDDRHVEEALAFLRRHMPASTRALDGLVEQWLRAFVADRDAAGWDASSCAMAFADALVARLSEGGGSGGQAVPADVIRFERDRLWLAVDSEGARGALPAFPRPSAAQATNRRRGQFDRLRPVRSNWLRISDFDGDVEAEIRRICDGDPIRDAPPTGERHTFVFQKRGSLKGRIFRINQHTRDLIGLCDGTRTVAAIADISATASGAPVAGVHDQLRRLAKEQVITLR